MTDDAKPPPRPGKTLHRARRDAMMLGYMLHPSYAPRVFAPMPQQWFAKGEEAPAVAPREGPPPT